MQTYDIEVSMLEPYSLDETMRTTLSGSVPSTEQLQHGHKSAKIPKISGNFTLNPKP